MWRRDVYCTEPFSNVWLHQETGYVRDLAQGIPQSAVFPNPFKFSFLFRLDSDPNSTNPCLFPSLEVTMALPGRRRQQDNRQRTRVWILGSDVMLTSFLGWCVEDRLWGRAGEQKQCSLETVAITQGRQADDLNHGGSSGSGEKRLCVCAESFSHVRLFATPWTAACQAPLSMGFSRQEYWSGLPCPPPGDLPNPGIEPRSPTLQADSVNRYVCRNINIEDGYWVLFWMYIKKESDMTEWLNWIETAFRYPSRERKAEKKKEAAGSWKIVF